MKTLIIKIFFIVILFCAEVFSQTDPNLDPNWDWHTGDYPLRF